MIPRDMAKLGLLYLHGGQWEEKQLLPAEWVELSLTPQGEAYFNKPLLTALTDVDLNTE